MDIFKQAQLQRDFVPDFNDGQKTGRPLKADGAAGTIALALLRGERHSVQGFYNYLKGRGIISNDTARRMREAVTWLNKRGVSVNKQIQTGKNYHIWYIPHALTNPKTQQLTNTIKGK